MLARMLMEATTMLVTPMAEMSPGRVGRTASGNAGHAAAAAAGGVSYGVGGGGGGGGGKCDMACVPLRIVKAAPTIESCVARVISVRRRVCGHTGKRLRG